MLCSLQLWLAEHAVSQQGVGVSACEVVHDFDVDSTSGEASDWEGCCSTSSHLSSSLGDRSHQQLRLDSWPAHDDSATCWSAATNRLVQGPGSTLAQATAAAVESRSLLLPSQSTSSSISLDGSSTSGWCQHKNISSSSSSSWSEDAVCPSTRTTSADAAAAHTCHLAQKGVLLQHSSRSKQSSSSLQRYRRRSRQYTLAVKLQDSLAGVTPEEHQASPLPGRDVLQLQHRHLSAALAAGCAGAAAAGGQPPAAAARLVRSLVFKGCVQYVLQFAEAVGAVEQEPQAAIAAAAAAAAEAGVGIPLQAEAGAAAGAAPEAPPADIVAVPVGPAAAAAAPADGVESAAVDDDGMTTAAIMLSIAAPVPLTGSSSGSHASGGTPVSLHGSPTTQVQEARVGAQEGAEQQALWAAVQQQLQSLQLDELPGDIQGLSYQLLLDGVLLQPAQQGASSSGGMAAAGAFASGKPPLHESSTGQGPDGRMDAGTTAAAAAAAAGCGDVEGWGEQVALQQQLLQQHQQAHHQQLLQQVCLEPVVLALQPHWAQAEAGAIELQAYQAAATAAEGVTAQAEAGGATEWQVAAGVPDVPGVAGAGGSSRADGNDGSRNSSRSDSNNNSSSSSSHHGSNGRTHSNSSRCHKDGNRLSSSGNGSNSRSSSSSSSDGSSSSKVGDGVQWAQWPASLWSTLPRAALGLSKAPAAAMASKLPAGAAPHPVTQVPTKAAAAIAAGPGKVPSAPPALHVAHIALQLPLQLPRMWREQGYSYLRVAVGDAASLAGALVNATWCLEQLSVAVSNHEACSRARPSTASGASSSSAAAAAAAGSIMDGAESQLKVVGELLRVPVNIPLTAALLQQLVPVGSGVLPLVVLLGQGPAPGGSTRGLRMGTIGPQQEQHQKNSSSSSSSQRGHVVPEGANSECCGLAVTSSSSRASNSELQGTADGGSAGGNGNSPPGCPNRSRGSSSSSSSHGHLPPELLVLSVAVVALQPPAASELTHWMQQLVTAVEGTADQGLAFQLYMLPLLMDLAYCITSLAGGAEEAGGDQQLASSVCSALLTYFHDQGLLECKMLVHGLLSGHHVQQGEDQEGSEQQLLGHPHPLRQQQQQEEGVELHAEQQQQQEEEVEEEEAEQQELDSRQQQQQGGSASGAASGEQSLMGRAGRWLLPRWWD